MNKLDLDYQNLLKDILENGVTKNDRTGTGTISVFGRQIRHSMKNGFPLLTTKKMAFKTMVTELIWFLNGDTNIKYLVDNDCHIWDGDAYKNFEKWYNEHSGKEDYTGYYVPNKEEFIRLIKTDDEFAKKWGDLGKIYGAAWRKWETDESYFEIEGSEIPEMIREKYQRVKYIKSKQIDQIANLINDLKTNPDSRRLLVSAWNVADLPHQVLSPCHFSFQVYTRELSLGERRELFTKTYPGKSFDDFASGGMEVQSLKHQLETIYNNANIPKRAISLMFNMRSTDVGLGMGFNLASYGLLLMMIAKQVNMTPDELIYSGGDVHLYKNHIEPIKEQLNREPYPLPTVKISDRVVNDIADYTLDDIVLENYKSHPKIYFPLSN